MPLAPNRNQGSGTLRKKKQTAKKPDLRKYYRYTRDPLDLDEYEFRIWLYHPGRRPVGIGPVVESMSWRTEPGRSRDPR
jgi:hypothetical protein